ncbi:UDP-N-acetyl-D-mannosamine dehydrogenase [Pseudarthrobacter raffinosi]|uniref:UDP-N-acetyl-D-mannosamine dehydrogenase n=1 Tax=Pseudarthrobacter raffinosi TaxID=2953651 RepID=UPI00208FD2DC|nr:UDP-N-acetyl-D-mannosamine dehydrogenase [Pseudarthrobacter sp. MDT3-28]MCO4238658.1 UDP-N-acetyl-D-mannosamine dehydrogenase [Pseudarthrobacter sp. MDT3-28]
MENKTVAVIGLGYIGLPTAAVLASHGFHVIGVDTNPEVVAAVNAGEVPFVEPDLDVAVAGAVSRSWLSAQFEMPVADIFVVAVPTPFKAGHRPDLSFVEAAARAIAPVLTGSELIILESTSPPGTTKRLARTIGDLRPDLEMALSDEHGSSAVLFAHCPERVLPGRIMTEMIENDRIVGGLSVASTQMASALYRTFCKGEVLTTTAETAETAKLVENAYRDVNIALANEISNVADVLDIDVWEVIELANRHPRVNILKPGPGVGGHCIAVDPWFLISAAPDQTPLMRQARNTNDAKPAHVATDITRAVGECRATSVTLLGLSYKADIDDLRESPSVQIARDVALALPKVQVNVVEPHISALPLTLQGLVNVRLVGSGGVAAEKGVLGVLVDHSAFRGLVREDIAAAAVVDVCGLWSRPAVVAPLVLDVI